jgi:hypothetical protein
MPWPDEREALDRLRSQQRNASRVFWAGFAAYAFTTSMRALAFLSVGLLACAAVIAYLGHRYAVAYCSAVEMMRDCAALAYYAIALCFAAVGLATGGVLVLRLVGRFPWIFLLVAAVVAGYLYLIH